MTDIINAGICVAAVLYLVGVGVYAYTICRGQLLKGETND